MQRACMVIAGAILLLLCFDGQIRVPACEGAHFQFIAGNASTHGDFEVQPQGPGEGSRSNFTPYIDDRSGKLWLTNFQKWDTGRIIYNHSVPLFGSFNASLQFQILTAPSSQLDVADGLAFFISPYHHLPPNSSGSLFALFPSTQTNVVTARSFFAVEFDTFLNDEFGDVSADHIGLDFDSVQSNRSLDTTNTSLSLYRNSTLSAQIQYKGLTHQIAVWVATNGSLLPTTPTIATIKDLSTIFSINQSLFVGVSATSGMGVQGTALMSFSFASEDIIFSPQPPSSPKSPLIPSHVLPQSPPTRHRNPVVIPLAASLTGTFLLLILLGLAVAWKRMGVGHKLHDRLQFMIESTIAPPRFNYKDLKKATRGFNNKVKVGEGGFSSVYKGTLGTGDVVAVKRLKQGVRMEAEFISEIRIISRIRHRNLLELQGWGYEAGEALLVYPFMENGSLDDYLFGKKKEGGLLDSQKKFNILIDVAAALEYLHGGLGECVLHRDVKAANVLLTENFEAMLSDFGLARLIKHNQVVTITAAGTPGYVAPEVLYTGRATDKADVYSFGVLALEVACARRVLDGDMTAPEEVHLVEWVWLLHQRGLITNALDEELLVQQKKWECVLHVALLCCHPWHESRPSMGQVHQALQDCILLHVPSTRPIYGPIGLLSANSSLTSQPTMYSW